MNTKNLKINSSLEMALLFNLFDYSDLDGWKTRKEIKKSNKIIELSGLGSLIFTSSDYNLPKFLKSLKNKGLIEEKWFDELDKRKRPVRRLKWRIKQDKKTIEIVFWNLDFYGYSNNMDFLQLFQKCALYQKLKMESKIELARFELTYPKKYINHLGMALIMYSLIHKKMELQPIIKDITKIFYEMNPDLLKTTRRRKGSLRNSIKKHKPHSARLK